MKTILHLYKEYYPVSGGVQHAIRTIVELTPEYSHTILTTSSELSGTRDVYGAKVIYCKKLFEKMSTPVSLRYALLARKFMRTHDIVCAHYPYPLTDILLTGIRPENLIYFWHSDIVSQKNAKKFVYPFIRNGLKKSKHIFVSYPDMAANSDILFEFKDKTVVSPYAVSIEAGKPADCGSLAKYGRYMLGVGRLVKYKGFAYMIKAMKDVKDLNLIICGKGPLYDELKILIDSMGLADRVFILNDVNENELRTLYRCCEFFVFPSCLPSEAFGIAMLEAMAYGKAVLNTQLSTGVNFVARNGIEAVTVKPASPEALAVGANTLAGDTALREKLSRNAEERARSVFDIKSKREQLVSIFENM